jgi:hypothetical protein
MKNKIIYPKNQKVWTTHKIGEEIYITTTLQNNRDKYFLWKFLGDNKWEKIGQNSNPLVLEEKIYGKQKNGKD